MSVIVWLTLCSIVCTLCYSVQESRVLKFWFVAETEYLDKVTSAYEFFKELVKPDQFPRGNNLFA